MTLSATAATSWSGVAGSWSGSMWTFWIFGVITLLGAIGTITRRNPVTAALWLVLTLFATGGLFLALDATFLAVIQVLVYAGAVMVLFVFVVMAVSDVESERFAMPRAWLSKIVGLVAVAVLVDRLLRVVAVASFELPGLAPVAAVPPAFGTVRDVGKLLFSTHLLPFEVLSVLLLVAVVAAVMITRRRSEGPTEAPASVGPGRAAAHPPLHHLGEGGG